MNFGKIILSLILISSNVFADCTTPTRVAKGALSPCEGYVFSAELETKVRTDLIYKDALILNLTQRNTLQEEMLKIDAKQLQIYQDRVESNEWEKTLYFILGAALTGTVSYGVVRALK